MIILVSHIDVLHFLSASVIPARLGLFHGLRLSLRLSALYKTDFSANSNFISKIIDFFADILYIVVKEVMSMSSIRSAIENTIPISLFNRGLAGKIFDEVKRYGAKVVMKNNTPECVLLSPDEYIRLLDEVNDARLLASAAERMSHFNPATLISQEQVDQKFGFTPSDYENTDDIEFE